MQGPYSAIHEVTLVYFDRKKTFYTLCQSQHTVCVYVVFWQVCN